MSADFKVGQKVRFTATFKDADETLFSPDEVVFRYRHYSIVGGAAQEVGPISPASTGVYVLDLVLDVPGRMAFRFAGSGDLATANQGVIEVEAARP